MREAVILSTARTPIGKAYRGAFDDTSGQELIGHAVSNAVLRANMSGKEIEDCVIGAALQRGSTGVNIGRQAAIRAGLPSGVAGKSLDRQCASGMRVIATAAKQVITDGLDVVIGGGVESVSLVQNDKRNNFRAVDPWIKNHKPAIYRSMLETTVVVSKRYDISSGQQDKYPLRS